MTTILVRTAVLVLFAILSMRLMGKRQVGQLQPFELVIAIMIADLATSPMESADVPLWRGLFPMLLAVALHQLLTLISMKSQRLRALLSGTPTVVIRRGKIDEKALEKLCFNLSDLMEELRAGGLLSPSEVGTAIMETGGKLSVFPAAERRAVQTGDMNIPTGYEGIPLTLVADGRIESKNLALCGRDEAWLRKKLRSLGFSEVKDVLLCYCDTDGRMSAQGRGHGAVKTAQAMPAEEVNW